MTQSMTQGWRRGQRPNPRLGTNGVPAGTGGEFHSAWAMCAGLAAVAMTANALAVGADNPQMPAWEPWVLEATSNMTLAALACIPGRAVARARDLPPRGGVLLHVGAFLVFTLIHVVAMMGLRKVAFELMDDVYRIGSLPGRLVYEGPKDLVSYAIFAALFWLAGRRGKADGAPWFDIHDGSRLIRVAVDDILAAVSAGNYVEFHLNDGRRPLMRTTLAQVEADLGPHGLLRTHRSWLVNPARVRGLERQRSGDWTVTLENLSAPLSRRYPEAPGAAERAWT